MISPIFHRFCYGLRDYISIIIYFLMTPKAREDASLGGLIKEECSDESDLTAAEDLRRLRAQCQEWNSEQLNPHNPARAIAIYCVHARDHYDDDDKNGVIYRSRVVRGWHQRRMRRLSR